MNKRIIKPANVARECCRDATRPSCNSDTCRLLWRLWTHSLLPRGGGGYCGWRGSRVGQGGEGERVRGRLLGPRHAAWLTFNDFSNFSVCVCGLCMYWYMSVFVLGIAVAVCVCVLGVCLFLLFFGLFQTNAKANANANAILALPFARTVSIYLCCSLSLSLSLATPLIWKIHLSTLPKETAEPTASPTCNLLRFSPNLRRTFALLLPHFVAQLQSGGH